MELGSPPMVRQYDEDLTKLSISELISKLRTAFQADEYDRVEKALIFKELKMKKEIEEKTKNIGSLNSKAELAVLDKMRIEEEMKKQKEHFEKQSKEGKSAKERYEKLMKKFKQSGPEDTSVVDELRTKICKLEDENRKAESQIEYWKMKARNLVKRVSRLEKQTKLLMNGDCSNVGVNTVPDSRVFTTTRVVKDRKETLPLHRNGSALFSSGVVIRQFPSKDVLCLPVIGVDSYEEECTSIQWKEATSQIAAENGNGGGSTGAIWQDDGLGMLKRKLDSTNRLFNLDLLDTDNSSSSSDSDFDIDRIPLQWR